MLQIKIANWRDAVAEQTIVGDRACRRWTQTMGKGVHAFRLMLIG
jgi:hypothetical protein